jgi:transposase
MQEPNSNAAGIDLSPTEIWVAVPPERAQNAVRKFGAFTKDLNAIVQWLLECGVHTVAMEATGVYWIALYQLLEEAKLQVCLVNAGMSKTFRVARAMFVIANGYNIRTASDCSWVRFVRPRPFARLVLLGATANSCSLQQASLSSMCRLPWTR